MKPKDLTLPLFNRICKEMGIYEKLKYNCSQQKGFDWQKLYKVYSNLTTSQPTPYSPLAFTSIGFLWTQSFEGNAFWIEQNEIMRNKIKDYEILSEP